MMTKELHSVATCQYGYGQYSDPGLWDQDSALVRRSARVEAIRQLVAVAAPGSPVGFAQPEVLHQCVSAVERLPRLQS